MSCKEEGKSFDVLDGTVTETAGGRKIRSKGEKADEVLARNNVPRPPTWQPWEIFSTLDRECFLHNFKNFKKSVKEEVDEGVNGQDECPCAWDNAAATSTSSELSEVCSSSSLLSTDVSSDAVSEELPPKRPPSRRLIGGLNLAALVLNNRKESHFADFSLKMVKEVHIADGSVGFGYETLFADGFDVRLTKVIVCDPYIRLKSQVNNFVVFCEVVLRCAVNLKEIVLRTVRRDKASGYSGHSEFGRLRWSLFAKGVSLQIEYSDTLHDREIRFDNGWTYRIGRGLDYFQQLPPRSRADLSDYNSRPCLETLVCITKDI